MRVFVTGASGHIGSALVPELLQAGHQVVGLARSEASALIVKNLGAEVVRGDTADLDVLKAAATDADAVIHLAFRHDLMQAGDLAGAATADLAVVRAFGDALAGSGKPLLAVGVGRTGDPAVDAVLSANPRSAVGLEVLGFEARGIRPVLVGVPPVTHSDRDKHGFVPTLIGIARATGVSAYVGEGTNHWPAGHTLDVARVFRLGLEKAPAGTQLFAATEAGIPVREIAENIARHLDIRAVSIPAEKVGEHFPNFPFVMMDVRMPNDSTRELLGWEPAHPGLIADLDAGHYFTN